jgi:formylglycine-generating enzyme required for sulfatase activity
MRATALTEQLLRAPASESAGIIDAMSAYRRWVAPLLQRRIDASDSDDDSKQELLLRLAMLPDDPVQARWLLDRIPGADPAEILAIRTGLRHRLPELIDEVWARVDTAKDEGQKLRLVCLVCPVERQEQDWERAADDVVAALVGESSIRLPEWAALLRPAGARLLSTLRRSIAGSRDDDELRRFAELYAEFSRETPQSLAKLDAMLQDVTPDGDPGQGGAETESGVRIESIDPPLSAARRQANLVTALAIAGSWDKVWPRLAHAPDPTLRSELIARLGINELVSPEFADRLTSPDQDDASRQQAIVLVLGEIKDHHRGKLLRDRYAPILRRLASQQPASGVVAAIEWTLRRWGQASGGQDTPDADDDGLPNMISFGPGELVVNDPIDGERRLTIERPFEIGQQEVTFSQYTRFRSDAGWDRRAAPNDRCPVHEVSWFDGAAYCNWLSEQAGIPEAEWCYVPNQDGQYADGMTIKPNALSLRGFRFPTANEWEYACRAGTTTYWSTGSNAELLDRYAWSIRNSGIHSHPVRTLRPNEAGLFDMHGNVWEWCHDRVTQNGDVGIDVAEPVRNDHHFLLRGGTYLTDPQYLGSATRNWNRADKHTNADGFRVSRTLPSTDP